MVQFTGNLTAPHGLNCQVYLDSCFRKRFAITVYTLDILGNGLLYGMLLDRMSLSIKNEWYDDTGRVYIYYTVDEIGSNLNCGRDKAMKLLAELDTGKGVGLIERIKQGQGKPTRIYVKRFTTQELPPQPEKKPEPPAPPPDVEFADVQTSDFPPPRGRDFRRAEVAETDPNQTKRNQTGVLPLIFNIHKVARGQEHFVAGFLAAVPMCLSRFLDGLSSRLEIKLWYWLFCPVNSPYYILLFPFLLEYVYTVRLDG